MGRSRVYNGSYYIWGAGGEEVGFTLLEMDGIGAHTTFGWWWWGGGGGGGGGGGIHNTTKNGWDRGSYYMGVCVGGGE